MRSLLFFIIPVVVLALSLGHTHSLSPGHALLHTATVVLAAVLLYIAISAYERVKSPRFKWLTAAFALLLAIELVLSLSMYASATWHLPYTDIPVDHVLGLLALVVLAYSIYKAE